MKKKISKILSLVIMTGLLVTSFTACGESKDTTSTVEDRVVLASEAFNREGIWFGFEDYVTKDETIDYILVFDGKGNVTHYKTNSITANTVENITFADLNGLSDEEIIELAKKRDKLLFEEEIKDAISDGTYWIEELSRFVNNPDPDGSPEDREQDQKSLDAALALESKMKEAVYQEPEAHPFTLKIETDGTGNQTSKEFLKYSYLDSDFLKPGRFITDNLTMDAVNQWEAKVKKEAELDIFPRSENMTVYDMQFSGFSQLVEIVGDEQPIYCFDSPDTEGIEVD